MPLTDYQRKFNLKEVCGGPNTYVTRYLALSSTMPNADGTNVTEPNGNGYARKYLQDSFVSSQFQYDSLNDIYSISNSQEIKMPEATGSWGTLGYFAIYDSSTGGHMIAYGALQSSIQPTADTVPIIRVGQCVVSEQ